MMMKVLEAGGMQVVTDNVRAADEDNPKGYYEFEKVKEIKEDASWVRDMAGKVFKMVSMLLYHLPPEESYRIVFMRRDMGEVLASQARMLQRLGKPGGGGGDDATMAELYKKHLSEITPWLERQSNMDVIYMDYNKILTSPAPELHSLNSFFSGSLNSEAMLEAIDPSLYRQRGGQGGGGA